MMIKRICILLAALLALSGMALANATGDFSPDAVKEKGPAKLSEEKVTLTIFAGKTVPASVRENLETNLMTRWLEACTNVHIDWTIPSTADINTALNLSLASGNYPDVYLGVELTTVQVLIYAEQGILLPLNDYLETYAPNYNKILSENEHYRYVVTAPDDSIYSFIRTDGGLHVPTWKKMFVYKPWMETYMEATGRGVPDTTEDYKQMLLYFRDNDMNGNGDASDEIPLMGSMGRSPVNYLMAPFQLQPYFHYLDVRDGKVYAPFATDGWKDGLAYIADLYGEGLLARDTFIQDNAQLTQIVSDPQEMLVGCVPETGVWFVNAAAWGTENVYEYWTSIPPLTGPTGLKQAPDTDFSCVQQNYITTACKHPEIAVAWNDYWFGEEGMLVNYMGFEGITYEWVDTVNYNGTKPAIQTIGDYATATTVTTTWKAGAARHQTSQLRYSLVEDIRSSEYSNKNEAYNYLDYIVQESIPQILWMNEEQANEISMLESVLKPYIDEMTTKFIVGDASLAADWDAYLAELEAMGLERWIALYQQLVD